MASWSQTTEHLSTSPPQAGKYWLKSVTMNVSSSDAGTYCNNNTPDPGTGEPPGRYYAQGSAVLRVTVNGATYSAAASTVGSHYQGQNSDGTWYTHGDAAPGGSITVTLPGICIVTSGSVAVELSGGAVGDCSTVYANWDWAFANFQVSYPGGSTTLTNQQYGTTASFSTGINGQIHYHGNGGSPDSQLQDRSYTASWSKTVDANDCAQYPNYISVSTNSQSIVADFNGVTQPSIADYLFEGWYNNGTSRSSRSEYSNGYNFGTYGGPFHLYAHYLSPPVWERRNGQWHKLIPSDMNAKSTGGTKTVQNVRSRKSDGTFPLDRPIYRYNAATKQWNQIFGTMIPPINS